MGGYAFQNPPVPLKSGKPESTPMPAPAQINRAPALSMTSAARCRSPSKLISSPRYSNPMLRALCLFIRLCQFSRFSRLGSALSDQLSAKNSSIRNSRSHIPHLTSQIALRLAPCALSLVPFPNPQSSTLSLSPILEPPRRPAGESSPSPPSSCAFCPSFASPGACVCG